MRVAINRYGERNLGNRGARSPELLTDLLFIKKQLVERPPTLEHSFSKPDGAKVSKSSELHFNPRPRKRPVGEIDGVARALRMDHAKARSERAAHKLRQQLASFCAINRKSNRLSEHDSPDVDWSSQAFVDEYRRGTRLALGSVYKEYRDLVARVLRHGFVTRRGTPLHGIANPQTRADLLQDVFLRAFSEVARRSYDARRSFAPYLVTIARNLLVDSHRQARRARKFIADPAARPPERSAERSVDAVALAEQFLSQISSPIRQVYELRFVSAKSQNEAAQVLGISRQALRTLERRLKESLRSELAST